jgi:hypothetical protein
VDPLTYVSFAQPNEHGLLTYSDSNFTLRLSMQILFFVAYSALAIFKWQRVEA